MFQGFLTSLGFERGFPSTEWSARQLGQESLFTIFIQRILYNGKVLKHLWIETSMKQLWIACLLCLQ